MSNFKSIEFNSKLRDAYNSKYKLSESLTEMVRRIIKEENGRYKGEYSIYNGKNNPVKKIDKKYLDKYNLDDYPNFSVTGNITGMKKNYYGKDALLVKCGSYIYNVSSNPKIYEEAY